SRTGVTATMEQVLHLGNLQDENNSNSADLPPNLPKYLDCVLTCPILIRRYYVSLSVERKAFLLTNARTEVSLTLPIDVLAAFAQQVKQELQSETECRSLLEIVRSAKPLTWDVVSTEEQEDLRNETTDEEGEDHLKENEEEEEDNEEEDDGENDDEEGKSSKKKKRKSKKTRAKRKKT